MKKLAMLATMLVSMVVVAAVPAIAQVSQGLAERSITGDVNTTFTAESTGNNSNQCVTPLQFGNTGPQQNTQGVLQYGSGSGSPFFGPFFSPFGGQIDVTGPSFVVSPSESASCTPNVEQSSAASSN